MAESSLPEQLLPSPALLHLYESRLRKLANPVVQDPLVWEEWRKQTEALLEACAGAQSDRPAQVPAELPSSTVSDVGLVAASAAWAELFDAVSDHMARAAPDAEEWARRQNQV